MQRRAAAAYVVFFVLIAAGSYAFIASAQAPSIAIENPDHELSQGSTFTVDGRTYTVANLESEESEGGTQYSGTLEWTNQSAVWTESAESGGSIEIENTTYDVLIPNESDPGSATLREQVGENVTTVERNGTTFVAVDRNGDGTDELIPIDEYEEIERIELDQGQTRQFRGNESTVEITRESLSFRWTYPRTNTVSLSHEGNTTLNGQTFFVYFESGSSASLTSDYGSYAEQVDTLDYFNERMNGFWGITILSGLAAILLTGLAYLPHKDT